MKTTIIPSKNGGHLVKPNDETRRGIEALGALAEKLVQSQDAALWAMASDGEFLEMMCLGAKVLRHFGVYATVVLDDAEAHLAFVTCCLLALRTSELPRIARRALRQALIVLSKCCLVRVGSHISPLLQWLPATILEVPRLALVYHAILQGNDLSLLELLHFQKRLEKEASPEIVALIFDLRPITQGLEESLRRTTLLYRFKRDRDFRQKWESI